MHQVNKFSTGSGISLSGIFPPIVTPFNANQSVAWDKLQHNVEKLNKLQLAGESMIIKVLYLLSL